MSNSLDPGQARHKYVGPDLDPNCLQRLSTDYVHCQVGVKADRRVSHVTSSALLDGDTNAVVAVIWFYIW